ncbi:MAG: hypothetical protein RL389_743 [Actinomycetota bacterium]
MSRVRRLIGWGLAILVLYSATMAFVMLLSLTSTYEKLQTLSKGDLSESIDFEQLNSVALDTQRAASAASDPALRALEFIPWLGTDIHAARVLSIGLNETLQVLLPFVEQRDALSLNKAELPKTLKALSLSTDSLEQTVERFDEALTSVKPDELHFGLEPKIARVKSLISGVSLAINQGNPLLKSAALMLNQPGKTRWFIATQNASELRAAGGLIGSYAILTIDDGKIHLDDFGADSKLLAKGKLNVSYASGIENIWGADFTDWRDINASAHIPDDGKILADAWKQKFGQKIDGVLFFSQGTVAHLVGSAGQVQVAGETLTHENTVDFLTKDIYAKFTDVKKKNAVVSKLMEKLFQDLTENKVDAANLLKSLSNEKNVDDIFLWSADRNTQQEIQRLGLSGEVPTAAGSDVIVEINNGGGNKLDAYLKASYSYELGKCGIKTWDDLNGRESKVFITLTNSAPKTGLPKYVNPRLDLRKGQKYVPSSNLEVISVYAPVGSTDEVILVDGQDEGATFSTYREHPVYTFSVELMPGQTRTVEVTFIEPVSDTSGKDIQRKPSFRTQRTLAGTASNVKFESFCPIG